jgi:hypothetical protein
LREVTASSVRLSWIDVRGEQVGLELKRLPVVLDCFGQAPRALALDGACEEAGGVTRLRRRESVARAAGVWQRAGRVAKRSLGGNSALIDSRRFFPHNRRGACKLDRAEIAYVGNARSAVYRRACHRT